MTKAEITQTVPCPKCGMLAGMGCITDQEVRGKGFSFRGRNHKERVTAAQRWLIGRQVAMI